MESLLAHDGAAGNFIESPALEALGRLIANEQSPSAATNLIASEVSHYRVIEELGSGGMGVVYKAEDMRLHRFVALKFLRGDIAQDRQWLNRFRREAEAASALNDPHICVVYDIGEHNGNAFIAMEFLDGATIKQLIANGPLPANKVIDLGIQIAEALDVAHANGIIHRDIKPANIFVTTRGLVKILDFGLAKRLHKGSETADAETAPLPAIGPADLQLTSPGAALGTVAYMSPEQLLGEELDVRTDVFSLGVVLYEMCAGRLPFSGETKSAMFDSILNGHPEPLARLNAGLPQKLSEIIDNSLAKDRAARWQSAAEILADLKRLNRATEAPSFRPGTLPALIAAVVLVSLGSIGWWMKSNKAAPAPASITQRKTEIAGSPMWPGQTDGRRAVYLNRTTGDLIYGDLAGKSKRIIFKKMPGDYFDFLPSRDFSIVAIRFQLPDKKELYSVVKTDGTGYREVAKLDGYQVCCDWSWDNRYLLARRPHFNGLLRISVADGQQRELVNLKTGAVWGAKFSPDGRFVAYQVGPIFVNDPVERTFVMPAEGGEPQLVYEWRPGSFALNKLLDWTADGRFLAFAGERTGKGALYLLPISGGRSAGAPVFVKYGDFEFGTTTEAGALAYTSAKPGGWWAVYLASLDSNSRPGIWKHLNLPLENVQTPPWPKFSEDGSQIVYVARNSDTAWTGERVVHLRNLSTGDDREVYRAAADIDCAWAAQQSKLFCTKNAAKQTEVFSVAVDSGEIATLHKFPAPRLLFIERASRDGRALYLDESIREAEQLVRWEIATAKETILGSSVRSIGSFDSIPLISPDERWLFRWHRQNIEIHPMPGGEWKFLFPLKLGPSNFTPDGNWIVYHDVDSAGKDSLFRIPTVGGTPERLGDFPTHTALGLGTLAISPDGSKILVSAGDETGYELWLLENFVPPAPKQ